MVASALVRKTRSEHATLMVCLLPCLIHQQDLPNYAQNQIPIFSLPQEWLWCESWCGNSTKTKVCVQKHLRVEG